MLTWMWGKGNIYSSQEGVPTVQPLWTSVWRSCKECKNESTTLQGHTILGLIPKDAISSHRDTCSSIFMLLFIFLCFHILAIKVWNSSNKMWGMLPYFLNLDLTTWLALPSGKLDVAHEGLKCTNCALVPSLMTQPSPWEQLPWCFFMILRMNTGD